MSAPRRLRELLAARRLVVAPGAYDGIRARRKMRGEASK